eukprot:7765544-Pyramimonas_sp.AAC.2
MSVDQAGVSIRATLTLYCGRLLGTRSIQDSSNRPLVKSEIGSPIFNFRGPCEREAARSQGASSILHSYEWMGGAGG